MGPSSNRPDVIPPSHARPDRRRLNVSTPEEISACEQSLAAHLSSMDGQQQRFVAAAVDYIPTCWTAIVEQAVIDQPERAKELGRERLSNLKAKLAGRIEARERIVANHLDRDTLWAHRDEEIASHPAGQRWQRSYFAHNGKPPTGELEQAVNEAVFEIASLLAEFGLAESHNYRWARAEGARGVPTAWSPQMLTAITAYGDMELEMWDLSAAVKGAKRQRDVNDARSLWDAA
jgi:hypothetical protein